MSRGEVGSNVSEPADSDGEMFLQHGQTLLTAVRGAVRPWLHLTVSQRGAELDEALLAELERAAHEVEASIAELVVADVEVPLSGPLERIRQAVEPVNRALLERDLPAPPRNTIDIEMRPADTYDLGPMTFRDLGDDVHDAGITWGAAKAHLHMKRRQAP